MLQIRHKCFDCERVRISDGRQYCGEKLDIIQGQVEYCKDYNKIKLQLWGVT